MTFKRCSPVTFEDGAAGNAALEAFHLRSGLVYVERADDDEAGVGREVTNRDRHFLAEILTHHLGTCVYSVRLQLTYIHVVLELSRDWNDRSGVRHGALDEVFDLLMLLLRLRLLDQIDLVLQDEQVLQLHDLHRSQVLGGLRLRARLVRGNEQQRCVHDSGAVQHGGHEDVVPRAVDEGHVTDADELALAAGTGAGEAVDGTRAASAKTL